MSTTPTAGAREKPCLVCGRVSNKPMCYRGEPWCCERHKQQVEARKGVLDRDAGALLVSALEALDTKR